MVEGVIGKHETKQSGRWERGLVFVGIPVILMTAILMLRFVWEETSLTLQQGPQMIGFSLAHGPGGVLLFGPLLLVVWFVVAFLTMAVNLWRRRQLSKSFWASLGAAVMVFGVLVFPPIFWQWLFVGTFARSSHASDLMTTAATCGQLRTVRGYLAHGVPPEAKNYEGSTAAFTAAAGGSVPVLELLANAGADLNAVNSYGDSPLEAAVENHHDAAAAFLRSKGALQVKGTPEQHEAASHAIVERDINRMHSTQ